MKKTGFILALSALLVLNNACFAKSKKVVQTEESQQTQEDVAVNYSNSASSRFFSKDIQGAISDFDKAIELNPANAELYLNRGYIKHLINDYNGAMQDYNKAININKNFAYAYNNRGALKVAMGDIDGAMQDYNQALAINPKYSDVYYNRANLKYMLNDNQGALNDYDKTISINPKDAEAYNNRGVVKKRLDYNVGALSDYTQAIALNPDDSIAYANRGRLKKLYFDNEGAAIDLNQAVALAEKQVFIKNVKPLLSNESYIAAVPSVKGVQILSEPNAMKQAVYKSNTSVNNDIAQADTNIRPAAQVVKLSAQPQHENSVVSGAIAAGIGTVKAATPPDVLTKVVVQAPTTNVKLAESYYIRGLQKCVLRDLNGAVADLNKAIENNSKYADAYFYRAAIRKELGDAEGFKQDYATAIQINPKLQQYNDSNAIALIRG